LVRGDRLDDFGVAGARGEDAAGEAAGLPVVEQARREQRLAELGQVEIDVVESSGVRPMTSSVLGLTTVTVDVPRGAAQSPR
jgi:hypothetical protein